VDRGQEVVSMARQPAEAVAPAIPSTPAQRGRYERVLAAATAVLAAGGEEALQMKDVPARANVSLATLYRYFPSKEHLLLAIALDRYEGAYRKMVASPPHGGTVRERVTDYLLREFGAEQRSQRLTSALHHALAHTSRGHSPALERIAHLHEQILRIVAESDGPLTAHQQRMLPLVRAVFGDATRRWMTGMASAADARFQIRAGCRLLELPADIIDEDLAKSAPAGASVTR
jgi:TetR/AcrR family transcriptional regulator, cholesterol catabolism regulator